MKILVGTTNQDKINIVRDFFKNKGCGYEVVSVEVESAINEQPLDQETTINGSINRAMNAVKSGLQYDLSLGLEGGLVLINGFYHLVCAVSVIDKEGNIYTGISKKLPLPKDVSKRIKNSGHFHVAIREFKTTPNNKKLVQELINREQSFKQAIESALMKYKNKNS